MRDQRAAEALQKDGWRVAYVWECELRDSADLVTRFLRLFPGSHPPVGSPFSRRKVRVRAARTQEENKTEC
jgi:hypothetical protein